MSSDSCDACYRIIETKNVSVEIPTIFGTAFAFDGKLCAGCSSLMDWFEYQFIELYEEQTKKINKKKMRLNIKTKRGMT
ncbi:MAG: hypothetical protein ISR79_02605 [Nitrosopumilus sp.]|nr:hypothetical protein [Nitrosopumilus sp.]